MSYRYKNTCSGIPSRSTAATYGRAVRGTGAEGKRGDDRMQVGVHAWCTRQRRARMVWRRSACGIVRRIKGEGAAQNRLPVGWERVG